MYKSVVVYKGGERLGDVVIYPQASTGGEENNINDNKNYVIGEILKKEIIKISYFSQSSERCPPLAVLHTITSSGICFKLEYNKKNNRDSPLHLLHSSCIQDNKTAVMPLGGMEIHLVAMHSRVNDGSHPCFWGFAVAAGLYNSCLVMLNLRCLGIVFDLDETLIVANTMRSFEDRIEALQRKMSVEVDPQRVTGMIAEVKRYQEDKSILKQYLENDQVVDDGKIITPQFELVPALSDNHQSIVRPLIRLQEKNIILTRINPQIRDTSVLVRLRPAWEDLRSYLIAKGRKRFEVYVCTMAERDYALEMWRLLDPESKLITAQQLLDRIVCVKSGLKKSLFNVFQDGTCHPKMALVIDDRLKVWDEKDQSRIHVVPAFAPYFAPQAEENNDIPVLCVARNVACNVRGGFFKEFDEGLLQRIPEISYEDNLHDIPFPPDVNKYLVSEDDASAPNGNRDPLSYDGMVDAEVERRLKEAISGSSMVSPAVNTLDPRIAPPVQYTIGSSSSSVQLPISEPATIAPFPSMQFSQASSFLKPISHVSPPEPSLQSSPAREEGEVPESELDPDTRRRLLILQHGQDIRDNVPSEPQFPGRTPMPVSVPRIQPQGNWPALEEQMSPPRRLNHPVAREFPLDPEPLLIEKHQHHQPFFPKVDGPIPPGRIPFENKRLPKESFKDDRLTLNNTMSGYQPFSGGPEIPLSQSSSSRDLDVEYDGAGTAPETPTAVLQEIAMKCGAKVEFKSSLVTSRDLLFSIEAWFAGEKIGEGIGRTRREAQYQAAEGSIKKLADFYVTGGSPDTGPEPNANDGGFLGPANSFGTEPSMIDESNPHLTASESSRLVDARLEGSKRSMDLYTGVREFVDVDGKELGLSWVGPSQVAEKAVGSSRMTFGQFTPKHQGSPRPMHGMPSKRLKPEFPRVMQRMPSSARYP